MSNTPKSLLRTLNTQTQKLEKLYIYLKQLNKAIVVEKTKFDKIKNDLRALKGDKKENIGKFTVLYNNIKKTGNNLHVNTTKYLSVLKTNFKLLRRSETTMEALLRLHKEDYETTNEFLQSQISIKKQKKQIRVTYSILKKTQEKLQKLHTQTGRIKYLDKNTPVEKLLDKQIPQVMDCLIVFTAIFAPFFAVVGVTIKWFWRISK